jgi:hypothetical protein
MNLWLIIFAVLAFANLILLGMLGDQRIKESSDGKLQQKPSPFWQINTFFRVRYTKRGERLKRLLIVGVCCQILAGILWISHQV